jgi:hypothetical protein
MIWKRLGRIGTLIVGVSVILFVLFAALVGTLTHPVKAIGVLVFMFCLFGIMVFLKRLKNRV